MIQDDKLNELKNTKFRVYSKTPLCDNCECYGNSNTFDGSKPFYIASVKAANIKNVDGKFYYTTEEFNGVADFWPAHIINLSNNFSKIKHRKNAAIKSNKCIVDVSELPAFNNVNEDTTINEYRFYLTLFNNFTVSQCRFERHDLYDAQFSSSKYDLTSKMQNADFLKSKDFVMINSRRHEEETIPIGIVIREDIDKASKTIEYGIVYINMSNQLSIVWC